MPERPLIEYNPRMTKIPRLSRQFGLQTLTGKLLALLLEVQGVIPKQVFKVLLSSGRTKKQVVRPWYKLLTRQTQAHHLEEFKVFCTLECAVSMRVVVQK